MLALILGLAGGLGAALIGAWAVLRARHSPKSQVELVDVTVARPERGESGRPDESPVLDVKVRNVGGQSAVLKRLTLHVDRSVRCGSMFSSMRLTPYRAVWVGATLPVSATYDAAIPAPESAADLTVAVDISQVVPAGDADRFDVRLGMESTFDTLVYRLHMALVYDGDDRSVASPTVAVAFPRQASVYSADDIRRAIRGFLVDTGKVRRAIDAEMAARGLPVPDWDGAPPRRRADLPAGLLSVDGNCEWFGSSEKNGIFEVTEEFWDPHGAVGRYLHTFEHAYRELVEIAGSAAVADPVLTAALPMARATLAAMPALRAEFSVPPEPANEPERPAGAERPQPAALMKDLLKGGGGLPELRARLHAGDEGTLWFCEQLTRPDRLDGWLPHVGVGSMESATPAAELLDEFLRLRHPDDPAAFTARRMIASQRGRKDAAGAAAALGAVVADQSRILGAEHADTCATRLELANWLVKADDKAGAAAVLADIVRDQERTPGPDQPQTLAYRHNLGYFLGESGDVRGAVAVFSALVPDALRVLGADDSSTINARHELARWRGNAGEAAGAFAAFDELLPDRLRVDGPEHPLTLISRYQHAWWQGEAGDPAGAADAFAKLLDDRRRILGADHADTRKTERALADWRARAAPGPTG
jgi:hypothetical protein